MAGTSVLTDLIDKCPPAEACRDAFERMSKATIAMCQSTTGFGSQVKFNRESHDESQSFTQGSNYSTSQGRRASRPPPEFDYNLGELFLDQPLQSMPNFRPGWQFPPQQVPAYGFSSPTLSNTTSSSLATPSSAPIPQQYDPRLFSQQHSAQTNPVAQPTSVNSTAAATNYDIDSKIDISAMPDFDFLVHGDINIGNACQAPFTNLGFEGGQPDFDDGSLGMPDLFNGFFFGGPLPENIDTQMAGPAFNDELQAEEGGTTMRENGSGGNWR